MRKLRAFFVRLNGLFGKERRDREMADEIECHLQLHIEENLRAGMDKETARRAAVLRFGGIESVKEEYRDRGSLPWLETLLRDIRYGLRTLRKNAAFSTVAILTLGLGIGANTSMFSVVEAVLIRPLPYSQPGRLVEISETNPLKHWTQVVAAPANFADWQRMNTVFTGIAGYVTVNKFLPGEGGPQRLKALAATGNLFEVLGVAPMLGRAFTSEETFEGKDRVAILTWDLWRTQFGADPHIAGRTIYLTGKRYEVVGVMPRDFFFPNHDIRIFVPLGFKPSVFVEDRRPHYLNVIARLRPDVSLEQAAGQMKVVAGRLERMYPYTNTKMGVRLDGFHSTLTEEKRPALLMLMAAVCVLFLIVCSNVANLQLGRAAARTREFGIRQALGAGRSRLIRQLLTESLTLSVLGGTLGLVLAFAARGALLRFAPAALPAFAELRIDSWVIVFDVAITFCAPLLFGIVPALASSRTEALRDRSETMGRGSRSTRDVLVACEVALSVVLMAGAGLLIRSLIRLENVDPGFDPDHSLSFALQLPDTRYANEEQVVRAIQQIDAHLHSQQGVQAAGATIQLALGGVGWTADATLEGRPPGEYERELCHDAVTPDYFRAMGTPLLRGRFFNQFDTAKSAPVTIVNEALEKAYFHGANAVGTRIKFGRPQDKEDWVTVVGVIADEKQDGMAARVRPEAYSPFTQKNNDAVTFVLRGSGEAEVLIGAARRAVAVVDRDLALTDITSLRALVRESTGDQRFRTSLLAAFAGIALFLAALGVYGVLAYSVAQRSREIGIRIALGASAAGLFGMVVRDGMRPVFAGLVVGLGGAYAVTGLIQSLLFGVALEDPATYAVTVAILAAVAVSACAVPAVRAIRVDPLLMLREQ